MGWRTVVITGNAKLDYKLGYLMVRKQGEIKQVHLSEIDVLMVESTAVSLTTMLLCELQKEKINVIFCDNKHNPSSELISIYGSHDCSARVREQVDFKKESKERIWTKIVENKIKKQMETLKEFHCDKEAFMLQTYIDELQYNDLTNREGHAAKVYFNALFGKQFTRDDDSSINAALDYGYAVLLSYFNREIIACGYMTQFGLFHNNTFNPFNLSSDLMEPYRPIIDKEVMSSQFEKFETEEKHQMLRVFEKSVCINNQIQTVANSINVYIQSVFYALKEDNEELVRFYRNEL